MDWVRDLHDKAEKTDNIAVKWCHPDDRQFIAACSPERVRALCELAEVAQEYREAARKHFEARHRKNQGREEHLGVPPSQDEIDALLALELDAHYARDRLFAALASLEPAREEET